MGGMGILADPVAGWGTTIDLHDGWVTGLEWMNEKADEDPEPYFNVVPIAPVVAGEWDLVLNGFSMALPDMLAGESVDIPVSWDVILAGLNTVQLLPTAPGLVAPLELENLELSSGPIALRLRPDIIPEPPGLGLVGLMLLALKRRRR